MKDLNKVTIDLELYDELKKAKEFFDHFSNVNSVFLGYRLNFNGNIERWILTTDETIKKIAGNLNESRLSNNTLRDKIKILEKEIMGLKKPEYPWYKRIFRL